MRRRALLDIENIPGRIAIALATLALLLRLIVPAGYMIMPAAQGGLPTLTLCSGQGPMPMPAHMAMAGMTHGERHGHGDGGDHRCPFAAVAAAVDLAAPPPMPALPFLILPIATARVVAVRPGLGLAAPPPPKTGPPLLD